MDVPRRRSRPLPLTSVSKEWFGCACCPPNIARLLTSLGAYVYSQGEGEALVNLYVGGEARFELGGQAIRLRQQTAYPWDNRAPGAMDVWIRERPGL